MKVLVSTLGRAHEQNGVQEHPRDALQSLLRLAELTEELGYDAFGVGERHNAPYFTSSPPVILAAVAERTKRVELFTTVTVISQLDPLRAAEDYATLDQLSGGRLSLVIGRGQEYDRYKHFAQDYERQWDYTDERARLLRRLLDEQSVTWEGWSRAPLTGVTISPRPLQHRLPIWHGSISSERTRRLAVELGDPFFIVNGFLDSGTYREAVDGYRRLWTEHGRDPADAVVGAGNAIFAIDRDSARARRQAEKYHASGTQAVSTVRETGQPYLDVKQAAGPNGVALVGSPAEITDRIAQHHEWYGNELMTIGITAADETDARKQLELFAAEVLPQVRAL